MISRDAFFISIEGVDGAGKSSHIPTVVQTLADLGFEVVQTREPGGTPYGENLRETALREPSTPLAETLLMYSIRAQHVEEVIAPALERGAVVVCDRFSDSSWAYQGGGKGVSPDTLAALDKMASGDIRPGLTLLFDVPPEVRKQRLQLTGKVADKFEGQDDTFFDNVRRAYLNRAKANHRIKIIDATVSLEQVSEAVKSAIIAHVSSYGMQPKAKTRPKV